MFTPLNKPFSQACENNYPFILAQIKQTFADCSTVLEIGSGTGQHAYYFARAQAHLTWQTSDLLANHQGILQWVDGVDNIKPPLVLDVNQASWEPLIVEGAYSANTLHIMSWPEVEKLFHHLQAAVKPGGKLVVYGPFNIDGQYTSESNAAFDQHLKQTAPHRAIRDLEAVKRLALSCGFIMEKPVTMPANNFLLTFTHQ